MKSLFALLVLASLAAPAALADGGGAGPPPAPPRPTVKKPIEPPKFADGKLTDYYWGVTYKLPGLEEKKIDRQAGKLFDGKVGRVQIEIGVWEYADQLSAKDRRDATKKNWDDKHRDLKEYAQGDDPAPWATFQEEAPSGGMRRHAYAWFVRGYRAFVVHSYVMADAEGGAEAAKAALWGIEVGPETGAAVYVQVQCKAHELPFDDPGALHDGAQEYLKDENGAVGRYAIAEDLLQRAVAGIPGSRLEHKPSAVLTITQGLGGAQLKMKKYDDAVATFTTCIGLAEKTDTPGPDGAGVQYNLACAYSLAGKLDDAFAQLDKAFAKWAPVFDEDLKKDADFDNCRKDPRWAKFLESKPTKK
jgi:tetratricopeptide (TPR) repeat protein